MRLIERAYQIKKERNFPDLYVALDIHDTVWGGTKSKHTDFISPYYPYAKEVLRFWSNQPGVCIILFTCSYPESSVLIKNRLKNDGIRVSYINENPEITNTQHGDFSKKFYYQIIIDDKAGFDPEVDWYNIKIALEKEYNQKI